MFCNFYTSFQADVTEGNLEIDGRASILFPCICSMVIGLLPSVKNMGEVAGQQQAGLSGDAELSML